jgi:hypothetical protein
MRLSPRGYVGKDATGRALAYARESKADSHSAKVINFVLVPKNCIVPRVSNCI